MHMILGSAKLSDFISNSPFTKWLVIIKLFDLGTSAIHALEKQMSVIQLKSFCCISKRWSGDIIIEMRTFSHYYLINASGE